MKQYFSPKVQGFTIPELLVAISILAVLGTFGVISFFGYASQSRDVVRITDINNIEKVLGLQKINVGYYPVSTNSVDVTYSGATVWSQGVFGIDSVRETGKIFGDLVDPKYGNQYSYSVTSNRKEYQIGAYFEKNENRGELFSFSVDPFSVPSAYASGDFNPNSLNPKIWLDAKDVDGDGNIGNNPSDGANISAWNNKSSLGAVNNPTLTNGDLQYSENGYQNYTNGGYLPGVFIQNSRGLRLNNSEIDDGTIFYVVQKIDPFGGNDRNGLGMYGINNSNYYFGYDTSNRVYAINMGGSPNTSGIKNGSQYPFIYEFTHKNGSYMFLNGGNTLESGYTNSPSGVTWGFNRAGSSNKRSDLVVSEILIFDYTLSRDQRLTVEGYLAHRWGYTAVLPSDHPYKSVPPEGETPPAPDSSPDAFVIDDVNNANPGQTYISNPFTVSGINTPVEISIADGEYSIDGASYTSAIGSVSEGSAIRVRVTSSSQSAGVVSTTISIGGLSEDYIVTTKTIDNSIDDFDFSPIVDAQRTTLYVSETKEISGVNVPIPISITGNGAQYKITDGVAVDVTGTGIATGVQRNGSNRVDYAFDDDLSTGWGSPNNSFPIELGYDLGNGNAKNVNAYTLYRSSGQNGWGNDKYSPTDWSFQGSNNGSTWVTLDSQTNQTIANDTSARLFEFSNSQFFRYYRILVSDAVNANRVNISEMTLLNLGAGSFTSSAGTVQQGEYIVVRNTSSSSYETDLEATLTLGDVEKVFTITTGRVPADYDPDVFEFTPQIDAAPNTQYVSNQINITGITAATSISISGGEYEINGSGNWSSASSASLVENNDIISVRGTSSGIAAGVVNVDLSVGSETATYSITTLEDTIPDTISFTDKTLVEVDTQIPSDSITITGINTGISINNVSGGEYSINGSAWTSGNSQLVNNDILTLRLASSTNFNSTTTMSLDISGQPYEFNVTTEQADITPDTFNFLDISEANLSVSYISESIQVTGINSRVAISVSNGEYRVGSNPFTSENGFVEDGDMVSVRLTSANLPLEITRSEVTIGGISDYFEVETKEVVIPKNTDEAPESNVYVGGNYNGLIAYAFTGATHYVLTTPSILANDLSSTDFTDIISQNKLVYNGFSNMPESYKDSGLTMSGGFDFTIPSAVVFEGTRSDLGSYSGLKEVDLGVRSVYNNFPGYASIAKYLDTFSLTYLENILGESIGINPIKPYYCSDILRTKLVSNIALSAQIVTDTPQVSGMEDNINNGIIGYEISTDPEYISQDGNAGIDFSWSSPQKIGYIRIYNTIFGDSEGLTDAVITFYNAFGGIIDTQNIGFDTTGDYVVDLDFESIGKVHYAQKIRIQTTGGRQLSLREVEIYLGGDLTSGTYRVDKDGLGGSSPYNVYCDMETDGGGWTRIGDNFISNGKFLRGVHTAEYSNNDPLNNIIVDGSTKLPPSYAADAYVLRHQGGVNDYYELTFDNIPGKYYAQEIRLGLWVDGTNSSMFSYDLDYETLSDVSDVADFDVIQTDGSWKYIQARIPLEDVVENFTWKISNGVAGPVYVTDLNMEVFYK